MTDLTVRIVHLDPMLVVCFNGFSNLKPGEEGDGPEPQAIEKLLTWAKDKGLLQAGSRRFFGYNNPEPTPASPNYGYDIWMTVDAGTQVEGEGRIIEFPGGLYAVTSCTGPFHLPETWQRLVLWAEQSRYRMARHQWLEEHLNLLENPPVQAMQFDIYLPIAE